MESEERVEEVGSCFSNDTNSGPHPAAKLLIDLTKKGGLGKK
jgi:hypothetical protein